MEKHLNFKTTIDSIDKIVGQKHILGPNKFISQMVKNNYLTSIIFHGKPGIGKTSLSIAIAKELKIKYKIFNSSLNKKNDLDKFIKETENIQERQLLIVEEIQRLNKDKQDILLQAIETKQFYVFATTTENPFHVINPALRSRIQIVELLPLSEEDVLIKIEKIVQKYKININQKNMKTISKKANGDLRIAINFLETIVNIFPNQEITKELIENISFNNSIGDKSGDDHFELLSALQKSIRGSDPDAALYYLSRLLLIGDIQPLLRRLMVISYEDIGLANPTMAIKVHNACQVFEKVGLKEGIIPLGNVVVEMAISPKSNSTYLAIHKSYDDIKENNLFFTVPKHINNRTKGLYKYPHNFPSNFVEQEYLPKQLKNKKYWEAQTQNMYEKKIYQIYQEFTKKTK